MVAEEWAIVIGVAVTITLSLAPWMLKVHAKLAVIASQMASLCEKLEKSASTTHELWAFYARHEARLDTHDVRISYLDDCVRTCQYGRDTGKAGGDEDA